MAWRNVERHALEAALSLLAVAVAAALFTSFLTLRQGPPPGFLPAWRAYFGADVLSWTGEVPSPRPGDARANWAHLPQNGETQLDLFWPDLSSGSLYLTGEPLQPFWYREGDELPSFPGASPYPRLVIPMGRCTTWWPGARPRWQACPSTSSPGAWSGPRRRPPFPRGPSGG
ncbi:MAG: hypothetical protein QJR00_04630 [Bacillota bacterium]|nr:hypothetical protein [Bacillota bacterium]